MAHIEAHIPGFNKSIYAKSFDETCETLKKKIDSHIPKLQLLIDCPFSLKSFLEKGTVETLLSDPREGATVRSDNRKPKITDLNRFGRVGLRSDNCKFG